MTTPKLRWVLLAFGIVGAACATGPGEGEILSDRLYLRECAIRAFDFKPNFFAADPSEDTLQIRLQRSDLPEEASDGVNLVVRHISEIRGDDGGAGRLGEALEVGLPAGVWPPGVPVVYDPEPALVNLSLYMNDSCDEQNVSVYAVSGTITFDALFSGDITETNSEELLTEAEFDVIVADPRDLVPGEAPDPAISSHLQGSFRFYFQRGQPAQPFP